MTIPDNLTGPSMPVTAPGSPRTDTGAGETVILAEERIRFGVEEHGTGRAQLWNYITTETITQTDPVSQDELTVHGEPIGTTAEALLHRLPGWLRPPRADSVHDADSPVGFADGFYGTLTDLDHLIGA